MNSPRIFVLLLFGSVLLVAAIRPDIKLSIRKSSDLTNFKDSLITAKDLTSGLPNKRHVKEIGVELLTYYYDPVKYSGICLYYTTYFYDNRTTIGGIRWLSGKPFDVFTVLNNREIHYFTRDKKANKKLLIDLKAILPHMPDSLVNDSSLLKGHVMVAD
jgi:hypothetical protein